MNLSGSLLEGSEQIFASRQVNFDMSKLAMFLLANAQDTSVESMRNSNGLPSDGEYWTQVRMGFA